VIHPFLLRQPTLVDRVEDVAKAGALVLLKRLQALLVNQPASKFVMFTDQLCTGDSTDGAAVTLCGSTAGALKLVLDKAGVKLPFANDTTRFLGKVGDVRDAMSKAHGRISGGLLYAVAPYALIAASLWLLRPKGGVLSGYPAEMARGAVYAQDCDEAQRRLDMAWKGLQQMEDRGDPQFVHEANKVAKIAKQLRANGCEVL
jgi:hypothetical protein